MSIEENDKKMTQLAKELPAESIVKMRSVLKDEFKGRNIPYNAATLRACIIMCSLIQPNLPQMYGQFTTVAMLSLYRLIDEEETGLITSDVQPTKL